MKKVAGHCLARHRLEHYLDRLFGYAVSLAGDRETAAELLHDSVVKALSARRVPADEPAYRAWLFRILRNGFIDRLRRDRSRSGVFDSQPAESVEAEDLRQLAGLRGDHQIVNVLTVKLALERLPVRHREIVALIDLAGLTYSEAAEVLDVPPGTVMSRISRARKALFMALNESNLRVLTKSSRPKSTRPKSTGKESAL